MKKIFFVLIMFCFLFGCASSEFWKHDSVYKNYSHMKFSIYGYKNTTEKNAIQSEREGWWGQPIYFGIIETDLKE